MTYYYQVTNTRNLASIKLHGLAPRVKRPAGLAQGATAQDRTSSENGKIESFIREFLYKILEQGHSIEKILATPAPELTFDAPLITGEIDYSTTPLTRKDNLWLDEDSEKYLTAYCKSLGKGALSPLDLRLHKLDSYTNYKKSYPTLARAFVAVNREHFITRLATRHVRTYYDIEFKVSGENIYFFDQKNMTTNYGGYAKTIGGSLYENLAMLRVNERHLGELRPDSAQGDAKTSQNVVPSEYIDFVVGASLRDVTTGALFNSHEWTPLWKTRFTELARYLPEELLS
jgi:hypothetical protein